MTSPDARPAAARSTARSAPAAAAALAVVFLLFHLPYLPASLEDLDSINFGLGLRRFDVAHHQPHPPGYPVFILLGKIVHRAVPSEPHALAILSVCGGALGAIAIALLAAGIVRARNTGASQWWSLAAAALAVTSPLYWFTAARPLSDALGLAAALAVQAAAVGATSARALQTAAVCAGVASGIRSQVAWLTVPLLLYSGWRLAADQSWSSDRRSRVVEYGWRIAAAFAAGVLVWLVPLVVLSGGVRAYWAALSGQGAEDLSGIQMLWTRPTPRELVDALYYAFVAPWAAWPVAAVAIASAAAGGVVLWRVDRRALLLIAVAFVPYLAFDIVFQETFTTRYALPLVIPVALLAVAAFRRLPSYTGALALVPLIMFDAHVAGTSIAAYSRQPAPAFRALADLERASAGDGKPAAVGMDRREALDLRRPIVWLGGLDLSGAARLPSPPMREWLEVVKFWNANPPSRKSPTWFVADPLRTDVHLVQHSEPVRYRWGLPYPVLLGGVRPNEMDVYEFAEPDWYAGEGWALTPEAAGIAELDRTSPQEGPVTAWVRPSVAASGAMAIGGRNFDPRVRPHVKLSLGGRVVREFDVAAGPFVSTLDLVAAPHDRSGGPAYVPLIVDVEPRARVAIEQFDAALDRPIAGFGEGWHELEFNPSTGRLWRWLSARGELRSVVRRPAVLVLEGESPLTYFNGPSTLTVRADGRDAWSGRLSSDFSLAIPIPAGTSSIVLTTDQTYVPADRSRRTADRRALGLRMFRCELRPAS